MHVDDVKFALEAIGIPAAAFEHLGRVRSRGDADENALLYSPRRIYAMRPQIGLKLTVDHACSGQERQLPEPRKLMFLGEPRGAVCGGSSARETIDCRGIHDNDLIRASIQKAARNRAGGSPTGDALDFVLKFLQILQVYSGDDGDSGVEQLLDILPAMTIGTARRVVICEPVNDRNLRVPL